MSLYAASVIHAQLNFPSSEINTVLAQLGPVDESINGIALYDFEAVRAELRNRNGIKAQAPDDNDDMRSNGSGFCDDDGDDECEFYSEGDDDAFID